MRKGGIIFLYTLFICVLVIAGCGRQQGTVMSENTDNKGNIAEETSVEHTGDLTTENPVYYTYRETVILDAWSTLPDLTEDSYYRGGDYVLKNGKIYLWSVLCEKSQWNGQFMETWKKYYLQELDMAEKPLSWKNSDISEDVSYAGNTYAVVVPPFSFTENGETKGFVKTADGECFAARWENGSIAEVYDGKKFSGSEVEKLQDISNACDKENRVYFFQEGSLEVTKYESTMSEKTDISLPGRIYGILQAESGTPVYWYGTGAGGKFCVKDLLSGEALAEDLALNGNSFAAALAIDGTLYIADKDGIYRYEEGLQLLYPLGDDYPFYKIYGMEISDAGDIRMLVEMDNSTVLLVFEKQDSPVDREKEEITIAFLLRQRALEKSIARFNRQSSKYHIETTYIEDPLYGDYAEYQNKIKMAVSTGKGPDILGSDLVADAEPYIKNGYIECVDDLVPAGENYTRAAFESCYINGKIYGIPYEYSLRFAAYNADMVKGKKSITLEELMHIVENSGASILQPGLGGVGIVYYYGLYDEENPTFIDWEKGESHLTEQPFLELLAFAKKYADTGEYGDNEAELFGKGTAFAMAVNMEEFSEWDNAYRNFNGKAAMTGYPRSKGNGYYLAGKELYLNAGSTHKEGAKEFLRYLLSEEEQVLYAGYDSYAEMERESDGTSSQIFTGNRCRFPVNRAALDVIVEKKKEEDKSLYVSDEDGNFHKKEPIDEEQIKQFYYIVENAHPANVKASALYDILDEELTPYFAGDVSAKEAAEHLQNRVQLYMNER